MNRIKQLLKREQSGAPRQKGQSIVLIALMMVAIIAFVGIAIDVGFIFARGSQLQAAIDSAALAGVVELSGWAEGNTTLENAALTKSAQFLNANHMPISVTTSLDDPGNMLVESTTLGATQYSITATWPVETFFLKVIGFREPINLTRSATAAVFSLADIYASRRVEDGVLSTSNQAVFGPQICVNFGDPFSPWNSPFEPDSYTYQYRILVPESYPDDILRVELFDPDSINSGTNSHDIIRSQTALPYLPLQDTKNCGPDGGNSQQIHPCLLETDEKDLVTGSPFLDLDQVNPYWFVRIDENRGVGGGNGNGSCGQPSNYTPRYNTRTQFLLYYFRQNADGTIERVDLVSYEGQTGDGVRDDGSDNTDMRWVSPGADTSFAFDYDPNPNGPDVLVTNALQIDSFEIDLTQDVPGIVRDQTDNARYIFLDVTTLDGSSENGFEVWAGPATYTSTVPSDVNRRNLYVLDHPGSHSSKGATVFGLGNLPMNSNYASTSDVNPVDIPLLYVSPEMAGQTIDITMFDSDSGAKPPVIFFFDSIAFTPDDNSALGYDPDKTDWAMAFGVNGVPDPDGQTRNCIPGSCAANGSTSGPNSGWVTPAYQIVVPGELDNCDYNNPNMFDCTPFYGGILTARYIGGPGDTYGWQIRIEGLPYLVK